MILDVSGTSRLGRFMLRNADQLRRASVERDYRRRGLSIHIYDMHNRQEMAVAEAAASAVLEVFRARLNADGFVETYLD